MTTWYQIWNQRQPSSDTGVGLDGLLNLAGYDAAFSSMSASRWRGYVREVAVELGAIPGHSILDVGCGPGAMMVVLAEMGFRVAGVDYSSSLIGLARDALPNADLRICEADQLATDRYYDYVVCQSVFQYFPDLSYAQRALSRMLKVAKQGVAVLDVIRLESAADAEKARADAEGRSSYSRRYDGLTHLALDADWFRSEAEANGWTASFRDQQIAGYLNSSFRFNVLLKKE